MAGILTGFSTMVASMYFGEGAPNNPEIRDGVWLHEMIWIGSTGDAAGVAPMAMTKLFDLLGKRQVHD